MSVYDSTGDVVWSTATGGPADDTGLQITQSHTTSYLNVMGTASSFGVVPGAWLTTSSTGDLSPNFAGESIPSELTYRAWVNTPTANASDMTVSAMSGVTPYVYNYGTFHVGLQSFTPRFESTLQYFNLSALPSTVIQVPFAKAFSVNLYPCIAPEATFQAVSSVGSKTLPVWLEFNQVSGNLRGTPTGSVRGLYFVELTVVVLNQQSVSFALNVTNTAPFYDGPTVLSTGLGNFVFSLRDYIFDAEGDAVSNYQLAPYYPAGSSVPIEPNPIATVNSFTGQLEGGALSGSGGSYVYNLTMSDSFGAVGWTLVTLVIHQPSLIASFVEKLLPEMAAASILLAVLFALWRQDQAHTNTTRWLQKLAILYCQPNQEVRVLVVR